MIRPRLQPLALLAAVALLVLLLLPAQANSLVATNNVVSPPTASLNGSPGELYLTLYLRNGTTNAENLSQTRLTWTVTRTSDAWPMFTATGVVFAATNGGVRFSGTVGSAGTYSGVVTAFPTGLSSYVAGRQAITLTNAPSIVVYTPVTISAASNSIMVSNSVAVTNSFNVTGLVVSNTSFNSISNFIVTATNTDATMLGGRDTNWWRDAANHTNAATTVVRGFGVSTAIAGRVTTYNLEALPAPVSAGYVLSSGTNYYVSQFPVAWTGGAINVSYATNSASFGALAGTATVDQVWTCPAGVTQIVVEAWGGGGAGGLNASGGSGSWALRFCDAVPGSNYIVRVGQGGRYNSATRALPGGGMANRGAGGASAGNGGGYSGLFLDASTNSGVSNIIVIAAGGAGAGRSTSSTGGQGGGSTGGNGAGGTSGGNTYTNALPTGGSLTAGGLAGATNSTPNAGTAGLWLTGGNGGTNINSTAGGGAGAGLWGGGGGGACGPQGTDSGGAGGSSYAPIGSAHRGPATGGDYYAPSYGSGGAALNNGQDGRLIIRW